MDKTQSNIEKGAVGEDWRGGEQFPVDTKGITKVRFEIHETGGDLARGVVTNDQETSQCAARREYYFGDAGASIEGVVSFTLRSGVMPGTQEAIDGFVGAMTRELDVAQPCGWCRGVYTASAARSRLYKAVDPDDSTRMIGLLIEQDLEGKLVQLTWYKTTGVGPVFSSAPEALDFDLVTDEGSAPSLDPNHIGGWTWYHSVAP
jgi:hypothetical protein